MKFLRADPTHFHFEFSLEEQIIFFHVLSQYPLVPEDYRGQARSAAPPLPAETQRLLAEALQEQRQATRRQIGQLLNDDSRFQSPPDQPNQVQIRFTRPEMEWLLQIYNDIRIGSWIALGSPDLDDRAKLPKKDQPSTRYLINLEIAGALEMLFLHALNHADTAAKPAPTDEKDEADHDDDEDQATGDSQ